MRIKLSENIFFLIMSALIVGVGVCIGIGYLVHPLLLDLGIKEMNSGPKLVCLFITGEAVVLGILFVAAIIKMFATGFFYKLLAAPFEVYSRKSEELKLEEKERKSRGLPEGED